jgi:hypothetical protein
METLVILVVAAVLSAGVVWWAMNPPAGRPKPKEPRVTRPPASSQEAPPEVFVLMPGEAAPSPDDRPSPAWSLFRLALTIAVVAAVGVAVLTVLGFMIKAGLDEYFTGR